MSVKQGFEGEKNSEFANTANFPLAGVTAACCNALTICIIYAPMSTYIRCLCDVQCDKDVEMLAQR